MNKEFQTPPLGELEIQVLELLWIKSDMTAKEVHAELSHQNKKSVNTVQSAMERLYRKSLLNRIKSSHSYRYSAAVLKEDLLGHLINDLVGRFQADSHSSVAAIINAAERIDEQALEVLEAEIRKRKEESQ